VRLTLRTMLAYLDGILGPEDSQDIAKKIEESAFASDLIHRIRDLLRRPSVTDPGMTSQGLTLGPNAMAEYLDNTLSPERVTEFEKICLDSDIHLAEVSACHQILTLVLGEPAEIDPASRQRMYEIFVRSTINEIPFSADSQAEIVLPPPPPPVFSYSSTDFETDRKPRAKPTVPEYLREPTKKYRWVSITTAGVVAVCLTIMLLMALGRFEPGTTMGNMLFRLGVVKENKEVASGTNKAIPLPEKTTSDTSVKAKPEDKTKGTESKTSGQPVAKATALAQPAAKSNKPSGIEQSSAPAALPIKPGTTPTSMPEKSGVQSELPSETAPAGVISQPGAASESGSATSDVVDKGLNPGNAASQEAAETPRQPSGNEPAETAVVTSGVKPSEEKTPPPSERLGRYMSEDQILLRNPGAASVWQRVASNEFLSANEQLLTLPTYRADITLGLGVKLRMLGGTQLELLPGNARDPAGIKIRFGRIVAMPLANAGTRLRIIPGEQEGVITFVDPEAVVAAEVRRIHDPGANPETEPPRLAIEFFVTTGHVLWDEKGQKTLEIAGPARFTLEDQAAPEATAVKDFPKWITAEPISLLDRKASATIVQSLLALPADRPAQRGLMELAEDRRKEVRWLAVRCLGYVDYFDPLVIILDDAAFKQDWSDNIDQLWDAIGRDGETAAAVRKSLENRYPPLAAEMYRMLWGYSDKDLESGEDKKLVNSLEDENLALRVLSFWNLKEITGKGQYYQP